MLTDMMLWQYIKLFCMLTAPCPCGIITSLVPTDKDVMQKFVLDSSWLYYTPWPLRCWCLALTTELPVCWTHLWDRWERLESQDLQEWLASQGLHLHKRWMPCPQRFQSLCSPVKYTSQFPSPFKSTSPFLIPQVNQSGPKVCSAEATRGFNQGHRLRHLLENLLHHLCSTTLLDLFCYFICFRSTWKPGSVTNRVYVSPVMLYFFCNFLPLSCVL